VEKDEQLCYAIFQFIIKFVVEHITVIFQQLTFGRLASSYVWKFFRKFGARD
jgi:hypothetical protein